MPGVSTGAELAAALPTLFAPAARKTAIGLAVSGGADSLALMLLARVWADGLEQPPRIHVYSVDHGMRPEAAGEVAFVLREAARLGFAGRGLRWTRGPTEPAGQAGARAARYRLIGAAMREDGAQLLLTAHHRNDQAETVLMRLAHGSGLEGLRGMDALADVGEVPVYRPFLQVPPELLREAVTTAGLVPVADPSNADRHYERVRWRQALPELAALGLDAETIAHFARRAGDADDAVTQWAEERFSALVRIDALGAISLSDTALTGLPRALGVKLLARVVGLAGGGQKPGALGMIERLHARVLDAAPLPGVTLLGASVRRRGDTLWLTREAGRGALPAIQLGGGEDLLWDRRFRVGNRSSAPVSVRMAGAVSRRAAERLVGSSLTAPAAAIRSAPLVSGPEGEVLALGEHRLSELITINFAST